MKSCMCRLRAICTCSAHIYTMVTQIAKGEIFVARPVQIARPVHRDSLRQIGKCALHAICTKIKKIAYAAPAVTITIVDMNRCILRACDVF